MEAIPTTWSIYRTSKPVIKDYRVMLWLIPHGAGFRWDVVDQRDRVIKRSVETFETPGAAMRAGTAWIETNKEDL